MTETSEIRMTPVESTNIKAVGYDRELSELHVEFKSGGYYIYSKVPELVHGNMMAADSVGGFLNKHLKNNYSFRKVK